ncbi:MAG: class I SAM-dependent methyltransferase [Candidatus Bathyarchaeota archaeon]|nr:class I SAM-dependent methyltransferase [Candidatus Bathyarchaeota archaeon]
MQIVERIKKLWLKYVVGYDKPKTYWDSRWKADLSAEKTTGKTAREELETIKRLMKKHSCQDILEIGCGKATLRDLPGYLGLDFSIEALKQSGLDTFVYADVTKRIPLPDKSQDAVLSRYMLLHIPFSEIENAVEEISRVAKNVVILKEPYGTSKEHAQPHCFLHNLPELFHKFFDGNVEFLEALDEVDARAQR